MPKFKFSKQINSWPGGGSFPTKKSKPSWNEDLRWFKGSHSLTDLEVLHGITFDSTIQLRNRDVFLNKNGLRSQVLKDFAAILEISFTKRSDSKVMLRDNKSVITWIDTTTIWYNNSMTSRPKMMLRQICYATADLSQVILYNRTYFLRLRISSNNLTMGNFGTDGKITEFISIFRISYTKLVLQVKNMCETVWNECLMKTNLSVNTIRPLQIRPAYYAFSYFTLHTW